MLRSPDGLAFARAGAYGDGVKGQQQQQQKQQQQPLTEMRVMLAVAENGRPVPTKSDGARFASSSSSSSASSAAGAASGAASSPLDVTLKLRQGATYCFTLSCSSAASSSSAGPPHIALESARATVWTRCVRPPIPPASAAGLHEVLGLLCGCCGGGGGGGGCFGVDKEDDRVLAGLGGKAGGAAAGAGGEGVALVRAAAGTGGASPARVIDSASGGGGDNDENDDGYSSGGWRGGEQVPVSDNGAGGGAGGVLGGSATASAPRFEFSWSPREGEVELTPDGARTEVAVEVVFSNFGRARLTLLCKVGPAAAAPSGSGSGSRGGGGSGSRSGAVFHLLRSAMTGEVRVLSRVPL